MPVFRTLDEIISRNNELNEAIIEGCRRCLLSELESPEAERTALDSWLFLAGQKLTIEEHLGAPDQGAGPALQMMVQVKANRGVITGLEAANKVVEGQKVVCEWLGVPFQGTPP